MTKYRNKKIKFTQVIRRLEEQQLSFRVMDLGHQSNIIVTQRGGRVLGPFLHEQGESILWINGAFSDADSFKEFIKTGDWNLGGERFWVAPEIQYHIKNRQDFWGSYHLPETIDPGYYTLEQPEVNLCCLDLDLRLKAYNLASGMKNLHLKRYIRPIDDPLRHIDQYSSFSQKVVYLGYEQVITLSEDKLDDIRSEAWAIAQLYPGGSLYIPSTSKVQYSDYFEPINQKYQILQSDHIRLKITGGQKVQGRIQSSQCVRASGLYKSAR